MHFNKINQKNNNINNINKKGGKKKSGVNTKIQLPQKKEEDEPTILELTKMVYHF
jgi:hypothetical protein